MRDPSAAVRAIVLHSPCTGWLPRSYRGLGRGHKTICRSWKASMAPSSPRAGSKRARHDDPCDRPHDPPRPPLSQRSFLWPKRLTAGVAAAKGGSGGAAGPAGVAGAIVTISSYVLVTRPSCESHKTYLTSPKHPQPRGRGARPAAGPAAWARKAGGTLARAPVAAGGDGGAPLPEPA